jgi:hypothetical protein
MTLQARGVDQMALVKICKRCSANIERELLLPTALYGHPII